MCDNPLPAKSLRKAPESSKDFIDPECECTASVPPPRTRANAIVGTGRTSKFARTMGSLAMITWSLVRVNDPVVYYGPCSNSA